MRLLYAWLLTLALAPTAAADLILTIGPVNLAPNSTGTVDVFVRSTTGTDGLGIASVQFQIVPVTAPGNPQVSFADPQADAQLLDPGYVFAGNSAAQSALPLFPTLIGITTFPNDTYRGGDGTIDPDPLNPDPVLVPTTDTLLTRLDLIAGPGSGASTYRIVLVDTGFTSFLDRDFNPIPFAMASDGTPVPVPEPATLALVGAFAGWGLALRRRNRTVPAHG